MPEIKKPFHEIDEDRLEGKYGVEHVTYPLMRSFFLAHEEYTHLVLCPDDMIATQEHIDKLKEGLEKYDHPVLSGIANVNDDDLKDYYSITDNLPHIVRPRHMEDGVFHMGWRFYNWVHKDDSLLKERYIQIPHSGFMLQAIRRDVVEKIPFRTDAKDNGYLPTSATASTDITFSNDCMFGGIPIVIDTSIRMRHMRKKGKVDILLGGTHLRYWKKGAKEPIIYYDKNHPEMIGAVSMDESKHLDMKS